MNRVFAALLLFTLLAFTAFAQNKDDDRITDQVRLKLTADRDVQGGAVVVEVKDGAVVLKGAVRSERAKSKAEKLAKKVKGVKSVANQLTVK